MTIQSWFHEQLMARAIASAVWTIILQGPLVLILKCIFSGYHGLWHSLSLLLHFGSVFSFFLIPLSICGITFVHIRYFRAEPVVLTTRWLFLKEVLSLSFFLLVWLYGIITAVLMNSYFSAAVPFLGSLTTRCSQKEGWCLNESHLFGVLFGGFLGLVEGWDFYFSNRTLVRFPHIQQHAKVAVRASILPLTKSALKVSSKKFLHYLIVYLMIGGTVRSYVLTATRLSFDESLDAVVGLVISLSLAFRCILIGAGCVFTLRLSNLLFQLFLTKPIVFPIVRFSDEVSPLLQEAITAEIPLLRLWACRDWDVLAEQSVERRSLIFSVSQPGNHPHIWNAFVSAILPQCLQFVSELKGETKAPKQAVPVVHSPSSYDTCTVRARSMALKSPVKTSPSIEESKSSVSDRLHVKFQEFVNNLKKKPIIYFLWGDLPDAKRRQLYAKAEPITLLIEGLSHFVAASYTEDKYGVVQKDLADILSMLLELQMAIDQRGTSSGIVPKRAEIFSHPPTDVQLKHRLKWTVKSSIYRLVVRFRRNILNVPLAPTQKQMLEQYLEFRVG